MRIKRSDFFPWKISNNDEKQVKMSINKKTFDLEKMKFARKRIQKDWYYSSFIGFNLPDISIKRFSKLKVTSNNKKNFRIKYWISILDENWNRYENNVKTMLNLLQNKNNFWTTASISYTWLLAQPHFVFSVS